MEGAITLRIWALEAHEPQGGVWPGCYRVRLVGHRGDDVVGSDQLAIIAGDDRASAGEDEEEVGVGMRVLRRCCPRIDRDHLELDLGRAPDPLEADAGLSVRGL